MEPEYLLHDRLLFTLQLHNTGLSHPEKVLDFFFAVLEAYTI